MLSLLTFGGLGMERDGHALPPPTPRRRLLALLTLVAGHHAFGISRDKLVAYLWPETDSDRGRNSLKQSLYSLRGSLGIKLATSGGGLLRLDPSLINTDLWQFQRSLMRGDERGAVDIYRGPFLDGFYLSGLDDFERWVETERGRLALRYAAALRSLAERAERANDPWAALTWWRTLAMAQPLSATAALGVMRALVAVGDPTGAREHARIHAAYVRTELGGPAAEAIVALANRLGGNHASTSTVSPMDRGPGTPGSPLIAQSSDRRSHQDRRRPTPAGRTRRNGVERRAVTTMVGELGRGIVVGDMTETRPAPPVAAESADPPRP